jgi:hypothetical protein
MMITPALDAGTTDAPAMDAAAGDGDPDVVMTNNDSGMEAEAGPPPCGAPGGRRDGT